MLSWTVYPFVFSERKERTGSKEKLIVKVRKNNQYFALFLVFSYFTNDELHDWPNVHHRTKPGVDRQGSREGQS